MRGGFVRASNSKQCPFFNCFPAKDLGVSVNSTFKTVAVWVVILLSLVVLYQVIRTASSSNKEEEINFSAFMNKVNQGDVKDVVISGAEVRGHYRNENAGFHTVIPTDYPDTIKTLQEKASTLTSKTLPPAAGRITSCFLALCCCLAPSWS